MNQENTDIPASVPTTSPAQAPAAGANAAPPTGTMPMPEAVMANGKSYAEIFNFYWVV